MVVVFDAIRFAVCAGHGSQHPRADGLGQRLTWDFIAATERGTSHAHLGRGCDDDHGVASYPRSSDDELLAIVVCDGAGSAEHGGLGAQLAVEASLGAVSKICLRDTKLDRMVAEQLIALVRRAISDRAQSDGQRLRDYACTYLLLLSSLELGSLLVQIGDGGIAIDFGDGLKMMFEAQTGEYANTTYFVTDENFDQFMQIMVDTRSVERAALFTDGLQSLAVVQTGNEVYEAFFAPFFAAVSDPANHSELGEERLNAALARFLRSDAVNDRTDDDKSLAVAVRRLPTRSENCNEVDE